ncbi:MAG: DUF167 domain-containing protein [Methanohalobium sp.]|uniref:DUF167 domain-containing protein n=1 Tax=Methanohalobium sp. TaxID=2837493 RepID=UPI00397DBFCA
MALEDAVRKSDDSVVINIEVAPGSKSNSIPDNYNQWRNRIEVKLTQKAQNRKANDQLIEKFSELFAVNKSDIIILTGEKGSKKSISITGIGYDDVVSILESRIDKV